MNDADLNQNIDGHSQAVDGHTGPETHDMATHSAVHPEQIYLDPTGTLGPVASAFSICALVKSWRQYIPPGSNVTEAIFVPDPAWLLAVNAVQLVIAIIANVFLLLNMTKRVRFSIAQPITIVGWYFSSICLTALCATASGPLVKQPEIDYVWSGAFYYGIYSAALYFIVASLMVVTVWGAQAGHYKKDFELTMSQRTLMLQTIMFMMYLLIGALIYTKIEGWTYLDAVYWADVTLFTVGYGDFSPSTQLGRGLLVPYAFVGVVSLGLVIGSIRSLMLDRGRRRLDARMLEKKRRDIIKHMQRRGKEGILEPIDEESRPATSTDHNDNGYWPSTELERRQAEFELMRKIQERANARRRWTAMAVSSTVWAVLWLVGAKIFQVCEDPYQGWSYFDSFYFAFTGLTTIGYGDLTPVSPGGKSFFVFWSLLALPTMTVFIANAGDTVVKEIRDVTLKLGNITILPGQHGFKKELKLLLAKCSCGIIFEDDQIPEDIPGFLGAAQRDTETEDDEEEDAANRDRVADAGVNDPEGNEGGDSNSGSLQKGSTHSTGNGNGGGNSPTSTTFSKPKKRGTMSSTKTGSSGSTAQQHNMRPLKHAPSIAREDFPTELPVNRAEYHLTLIDEIARVTKHLQQSPPRKYTFKEWAWYLKLMGEDESSAETHRRPEPKPPGHHHGSKKPSAQDKDGEADETNQEPGAKWSWVGHRSPLMDTQEEAEWVLDRLVHRLREELQAVVTEQSGAKGVTQVREEERQREHLNEDDPKVMGQ